MRDAPEHPDDPISDEMSEYLQMFLDETEEQLDDLVETLLVLERAPESVNELNEAFRLIHSIKGSAGMMGFDNIALLTHHLESRFEAFRSHAKTLDAPTMGLVLRCIDFLRDCTRRLRNGDALGSAADLLRELSVDEPGDAAPAPPSEARPAATADEPPTDARAAPVLPVHDGDALRVTIDFEPGLPLADLKARLIVSRLSALGDLVSTQPDAGALDAGTPLDRLEVVLTTTEAPDTVRAAVDLDGVQHIHLHGAGAEAATPPPPDLPPDLPPDSPPDSPPDATPLEATTRAQLETDTEPEPEPEAAAPDPAPARGERAKPRVAETMRVDIDRLDRLMNLAGELVVNRARFVQVTGQATASFRTRNVVGRVRDFGEALRKTIDQLGANGAWTARVDELQAGLDFLEEQSELWDSGRRCFTQVAEALDQLTRISDSLQQSVLDTRMVPVAPLFNRFNRVVRDLSQERGKQVRLEIHGEKTELDKRMIDELGDPLVHLVRNSIDHGLEPAEVRRARGKPDIGTICLEASHRGSSVYVSIRDDGGGIDADRIRARIAERGLLAAAAAETLSDAEAIEFIWHAGFSTAPAVTDISGRGVGMDVVGTRIADLNGTVEVDSTLGVGTTFTIRLPLTLAIISSLLIRIRNSTFSIPIDDVREIVSIPTADLVHVRGKHAIEVRGEFIPLIGLDDLFDWPDTVAPAAGETPSSVPTSSGATIEAVVLQVNDRTISLRVDELLGSQDIVIKSLSENFIQIRGLSGASILGDGSVCLMLDVGTLIDLATGRSRTGQQKDRELDPAR